MNTAMSKLPSKYKFSVQANEPATEQAPSCPPRKPASKTKAAKTKALSEAD